MPGLGDQDGVYGVVLQWNVFRGAQQCRRVGQCAAQYLEHLGDRVDGDHVEAALDESGGQLAGAGAEIENVAGSGG